MLSLLGIYGKVPGLLASMVLGAVLPQLHEYSFLIRYLLMVMLFFAFLDIRFTTQSFQKGVLGVLLANLAVGFLSYALVFPLGSMFALTAFMTAIAPTAIAAPVITGFIRGRIEYVVAAVLVTNIASAVIIPLTLPFLIDLQAQPPLTLRDVLLPVLAVMLIPLIAAHLAPRLPFRAQQGLRAGKKLSFGIWLLNLLLISANASNFLRTEAGHPPSTILVIALISLVICVVNFGVGALLGGRQNWREASQSLGQKNLSFVIWIALTFLNPLVAMGPTFYILFHHLYNSWSIYRFERRRPL